MGSRGPKPRPTLERLNDKSEWRGDCLVWTGTVNKKGYGTTTYEGATRLVHRVSWVEHFGSPPPEMPCVLHRCDNPPCWNPEHLFLGTKADNNRDMQEKGRASGRVKFAECRYGHQYDEENTYFRSDGARACRRCHADAQARYVGRK